MGSKKFIIIIGLIALVILLAIIITYRGTLESKTKAITDKTEYEKDDVLKVKIENNLEKNICFSSCYPYYIEKKDGVWKSYSYSGCLEDNLIEKCAGPNQTKAFQLDLPGIEIEKGTHRLAIPICVGCNLQELFREDNWLYSNEFYIK
jgi:hypothetical protein